MSSSIFEVEYHPGEEVVLRFKPPRFRRLPDSGRRGRVRTKKDKAARCLVLALHRRNHAFCQEAIAQNCGVM